MGKRFRIKERRREKKKNKVESGLGSKCVSIEDNSKV